MAAGRRTDWLAPFRHPIFAAVLVWEFVSFWIAFISQAVVEAKAHAGIFADAYSSGSPVGVLWFAMCVGWLVMLQTPHTAARFLQLALLAATYYTLATGTLAIHRSLLAVFTAVGLVFSVIGTDRGIYGNLVKPSASKALGVGWLFMCFINIFWLFIFGADETNAVFARVVYFGNTEHFMSARPRATHTRRAESAQNMTGGISSTQYQTGGVGGGGFNSKGRTSDVSFVSAGSLANQDPYAPVKRSSPPRSLQNAPAVQQPLMGASLEEGPVKEERSPVAQAKALYAYTANPDDPSELSFGKGELLDIFDKSGKWWQAKKPDGTIGIIPSN